ncbi:MAG TPA: NAD(P)/FAD-dependent oxidoreductase [Alphaproteobacteria bacterium]|nr:NAD(P)/FAD-dependent oxidoreductase [Alphaproteobacteria bacterium]
MSDFTSECVVIGAGVVGLAVARELAQAGVETYVLERESGFGMGTSSRNSEVIHAGIYYPPGSLKAWFCVEGRGLLYDYCRARSIPHRNCGKVIVATQDNQKEKLNEIEARAKASGVNSLKRLSADDVHALEPEVKAVAGLFSPETGIIDSHAFMQSLLDDFMMAGGHAVMQAPLLGAEITSDGITLRVGGKEPCTVKTRKLVNAAGLDAVRILKMFKGFPAAHIPPQYYAKGNYFILSTRSPFTHLVYPIPEAAGLGIHATLDMGGACRFGPDVEWVDDPNNLEVNPARAESFYKAIRTYWPGLMDGALQPGYAGMRPKLQAPTAVAADFVIQGKEVHGIKGLVNLLGIESPGLTSSLAIAAYTKNLLFS